jgi:hypothetical protein
MRRLSFLLVVAACGQSAPPPATVPIASGSSAPTSVPPEDCGAPSDYVAQPAWSGEQPSLPPPPSLPTSPIKIGDAYTVFGAVRSLRSADHAEEVTSDPIAIVGYVADSNIPRAPACAIHRTGKADPPGCEPEMPSFWIADGKSKDATTIRVVGWARNFAVVLDAMTAYRKLKPGASPKAPIVDDILNVEVPFPLPAVGMKVKVTGKYGFARPVASSLVREATTGVMVMAKMELLEPAPAPASFAKP